MSPLTCLLLTHLQAQGNNEKCCQNSTCRKLIPEHCIEWNEQKGIAGEDKEKDVKKLWLIWSNWAKSYVYECEREMGNDNYVCLKNQMYILCSYDGIS